MVVECNNCNVLVKAEVLASYVKENAYDWMDSEQYTFCKCPQCSLPILAIQNYDFVAGNAEWGIPQRLYPENAFHINPVIPEELKKALIECIQCYKANAFTATAVMCRRAIEGFCLIKGVKEANLDKAIKKLKELGIINDQLFEWANQLRLIGNEAAHNINSQFYDLDAKDILDFTIAILDFTYSFKDKFEKFMTRIKTTKRK